MKKVLAIAPYPYLPYFSGGQKFIAQFLEYLSAETELTVIGCKSNDPQLIHNYRLLPWLGGSFSRYMNPGLILKVVREARAGNYDVLIWEHPYQAWMAWLVHWRTGIPFIIHTHNIEYQRFRSMGKWWWPMLKFYERWAFRKADKLFFITPEDQAFTVKSWGIPESKCIDLPFAVTATRYPDDKGICREKVAAFHGVAANEKIILFNGLLRYPPNLEALKVILDKINPVLHQTTGFSYKLIVCGKDLPAEMQELLPWKEQHVIYAGFVTDIDLYFKAADIFLNPVQSGGGIKTKMVEALALGATVVATETGAMGMNRESCGSKLVVVPDNDWQAFANAVISNRNNYDATPEAFYEKYSWGKVARRIAETI